MNFIFQPDLSFSFCFVFHTFVIFQTTFFVPGGYQYLRVCQDCHYPKGKDFSQHLDEGWLETGPLGNSFKSMQIDIFKGRPGVGEFLFSSSVLSPRGDNQLRTYSLFAAVLWDLETQVPLATRVMWSKVHLLGGRSKSWGTKPRHKLLLGRNQWHGMGQTDRRDDFCWPPQALVSKKDGNQLLDVCSRNLIFRQQLLTEMNRLFSGKDWKVVFFFPCSSVLSLRVIAMVNLLLSIKNCLFAVIFWVLWMQAQLAIRARCSGLQFLRWKS